MQTILQANVKKSLFTLPFTVSNELDEIAKELHKRKSHIIVEALEMYFDTLDLKIAKQRLEAVKSGKENVIPFDEILKENGLA